MPFDAMSGKPSLDDVYKELKRNWRKTVMVLIGLILVLGDSTSLELIRRKQVDKSHYQSMQHDTKPRFASYWHQLDEILKFGPESVLDVGKGSGFLSACLKSHEVNTVALDVNVKLLPDVVGSVLELPFKQDSCDVVVCF